MSVWITSENDEKSYAIEAVYLLGCDLKEQAGSTLYDEISQELQLLDRQGIKALGGIIVE